MAEKCCNTCRFFAELKKPYERSDGARIFGYCFKAGDKNYSLNMGKGFPVFIDSGEGRCKDYKKIVRCAKGEEDKNENTSEMEL